MNLILDKGETLYAALNAGDVQALRHLLSEDFQGQLSPGLPQGLGGYYSGLEAMMRDAWGHVGALLELELNVHRFWDAGAMLIVQGCYDGTVRRSGRSLHAEFAHFWAFDGAFFTRMQQITDTALWHDALDA